jgi:hypothetical protein
VIRVSLAAAIEFIANLERREIATFPSKYGSLEIERSLFPASDYGQSSYHPDDQLTASSWADSMISAAEEQGWDKAYPTWQAIRRIKAREREQGAAGLATWALEWVSYFMNWGSYANAERDQRFELVPEPFEW